MAHINLLPWRERLREERKREFFSILAGVVVIAGGLIFLVHGYIQAGIDNQNTRNEFIREEIRLLDARVIEINELQQQKEEIRARMNVINNLQGTRPVIVRIFDGLVKTMPEGVYYRSLDRLEETISIVGISDSYSRLTELMRRLDESEWFDNSDLSEVTRIEDGDGNQTDAYGFSLNLTLELPRDLEDEV